MRHLIYLSILLLPYRLISQEIGDVKKTEVITDYMNISSGFGMFIKQYNDTSFVITSRTGGAQTTGSQGTLNFHRLTNNQVSSVFRITRNTGGFGNNDVSSQGFGTSMEVLNDINGDGILRDIVVGIPQFPGRSNNTGGLWFLSLNKQGEVIKQRRLTDTTFHFTHLSGATWFGHSIANIGDIDGNGYDDIAVGAPLSKTSSSNNGEVYIVLLEKDGAVKSYKRISDRHELIKRSLQGFGYSVVNMGDMDGDGINDLAVSEANNRTIWILYLKADGNLKSVREISSGKGGLSSAISLSSNFGRCITNMGDMDGDGINELAIGEQTYVPEDSSGNMHGRAWIFFFDTNGFVKKTIEINNQTPGFTENISAGDRFGYSIARIPDMDGDGAPELAIGVPGSNPTSLGGKVIVLYLHGLPQAKVKKIESTSMNVQIFPNPAHDNVQIQISPIQTESLVLSMLTMHGQKVMEKTVEASNDYFSVSLPSNLSPGMYFFNLQTKNQIVVKKIMIH